MECHEVQPLLIDLVDHKLPAAMRVEVELHLAGCAKCKTELEELQMLFQTMADAPIETPEPSLRDNFDSMLQSELNRLAAANNVIETATKPAKLVRWPASLLRIAAIFIILIGGILIGMRFQRVGQDNSSGEISKLNTEVKDMKEILMFTLLKEESASQRIKAVNYSEEIPNPNQKVISALLNILDHDKNVNVRLASVYSLARFSGNRAVMDSLVASLSKQTEPIVQIVLINILTEKREIKAIKPIQEIISNGNTMKEVKDIAEKSLKLL